jgi:hypothetical protein
VGWYPAERLEFPLQVPSGGLAAYVRGGDVIMLETLRPPPTEVLGELGEPDGILPQELFRSGSYVHEYVYATRGLLLSVAEQLRGPADLEVLRARGIKVLASVRDLGPDLYRPLDDVEVNSPPLS